MNKWGKAALILGLALGLFTCIKPVEIDLPELDGGIVISATLYTQKGHQQVRINRLAPFTTDALNYPVQQAQVWVTDHQGFRQDFKEDPTRAGIYLPNDANYVGEIGKTYVLHVVTKDQYTFTSSPQTIRPAPPIKRVYREEIITDHSILGPVVSGFNILLDMDDAPTEGDYYRWSWVNYKQLAYCFEREEVDGLYTAIPCCTPCWDIYRCYINCADVASDAFVNGKSITRHFITKIPYCAQDYYLEIQQHSISKEAFNYWQTVDQLSSNNGSLFDAAPAAVRGNLSCTSHPEQVVYGLFEASDFTEGGYFISRINTSKPGLYGCDPIRVPEPSLSCAACVESIYRTRIKPRFWTK